MSSNREYNPWKNKTRIELIACLDILIALAGITHTSYRMFTFYWNPLSQDTSDMVKEGHIPFYIFVWVIVTVLYMFQIGCSAVLYSAINEEAMETDPVISVQKCNCWLRCSRVMLVVLVTKLCVIPIIMVFGKFTNVYTIVLGFAELLFRTAAIFVVKQFIHDLQQ